MKTHKSESNTLILVFLEMYFSVSSIFPLLPPLGGAGQIL